MSELVSIIMPCFNGERFIVDSIESVLGQNYQNFELLIIDDHSSDGSRSVIEAYCLKDDRVKLIKNYGQSGAANARNLGINHSLGRYIAFLDCDDIWHTNKLTIAISFMKSKDLAFSWSSYSIIDQQGNFLRVQRAGRHNDYHSFLKKIEVIGCLTAVYDSSKLGKVYAPLIKMRNDYALWVLIFRSCDINGFRYMGCNDNLASFRSHSSSLTSNKFKAAYYQWFLYRRVALLTRFSAAIFMFHYVKNGLMDRFFIRTGV